MTSSGTDTKDKKKTKSKKSKKEDESKIEETPETEESTDKKDSSEKKDKKKLAEVKDDIKELNIPDPTTTHLVNLEDLKSDVEYIIKIYTLEIERAIELS